MAKFALECPKCGSLNTASTFILAKKVIKCVTCGEEINVGQSRMTSKTCPECNKVVVLDQAKLNSDNAKHRRCPGCGALLGVASTTAKYKLTHVVCPQCTCSIEVDMTKEQASCPVCDYIIDVQKALAKEGLVSPNGVSVIKYEGDNETFIWKHPIEDFNLGSQLIVHESQEAIFFLNGEALDSFGPGRHILETENLPVLKKIYNLPTGKPNPFHAEVYFINKTVQMGIKWGTDSRVRFIEPNTGIPLDIGASGELNLEVLNGRKLLLKLVGTTGSLTRTHILSNSDDKSIKSALRDYFRPMIMTTIKGNLATVIKTEKINILEIDERLEQLSSSLREKVSVGFEEYGLHVPQFFVTNVSLPEEDKNFKRIRDLLAASYLEIREREVRADIAAAQRKIELEEETTLTEKARFEAERQRIEAQAAADRARYEGMAEAEVMAAKGYNQKDVLQADVQKAYAEGIGNMGANGGTGGGMMSDILGMGIGMAALGNVGSQMSDVMKSFAPASDINSGTVGVNSWKCSCGAVNSSGKFCVECGKEKVEPWDCILCGAKGNTGKFCAECGKKKLQPWTCDDCGAKGNTGKFCSDCGKPKKNAVDAWDCSCGAKDNSGKFCSECGKPKEETE